jgi:hypothetical protein
MRPREPIRNLYRSTLYSMIWNSHSPTRDARLEAA